MEPFEDPSKQEASLLNRRVLPPALMAFLTHIIWGALMAFFPLYALSQGMTNPGFFFAAYAVVLILGRTLGGKLMDRYSREKVMLPCLTTYIISMAILAFSKSVPMFIFVAVVWGMGNAFLMPSLLAYALERAGSSRGTVTGTFTAIGDLGVSVGPIVMGFVLRLTSYPVMFLCLSLTGLINLGYFYFFVRERKEQ